jgi:two-component system chemotaxis sensor kinase CheA
MMELCTLSNFSLFETLLEAVFVLNAKSEIIYCNPAAAVLIDIAPRKILKIKSLGALVQFATDSPELTLLTEVLEPTPYKESDFSSISGRLGRVQYSIQPATSKDTPVWIIYLKDVTLEATLQAKYQRESQQKETYIRELEVTHRELERYSKNLKKLVEDRTQELTSVNSMMRSLLDSLEQGFFMFDREGNCLPVFSNSCLKLLECNPLGKKVWEVLKIPENKIDNFKKWIFTMFENMLPFEDLAVLGPQRMPPSDDMHIKLRFVPLRNKNVETLDAIVVMATDNTLIDEAKEAAEQERNYAMMIVNILKRRKEMTQFVFDTQRLIEELRKTLSDQYGFNIQTVFRCLHTIKGGASSFSIHELSTACHQAEQILQEISQEGLAKESLFHLNEQFSNLKYQFQNFLKSNEAFLGTSIIHGIRTMDVPVNTLTNLIRKLSKVAEVREHITNFEKEIFYVPVRQFLEGYNDAIQSLGHQLGKKIKPLRIEGGDISIHREFYSELFATLIHQFNNSVDHGIEEPVLRRFHHKDESGEIRVSVSVQPVDDKEYLMMRIADDGQGIDPDRIRQKLNEKGIEHTGENDEDVIQHVFSSQFSTKDSVTIVSGRGVGMDAILHAAHNLGGTAYIKSDLKRGTELWIRVPYARELVKLSAVS